MNKQARCKHMTCNGLMAIEYDRIKCVKCGRSVWRNFNIRKPLKSDQTIMGPDTGPRTKGFDNIKARI